MKKPVWFYRGMSVERAGQVGAEGILTERARPRELNPPQKGFALAPAFCVTLTDCIALPYAFGLSVRGDGDEIREEGAIVQIQAAALDESLLRPTLPYVARQLASHTEWLELSEGLRFRLSEQQLKLDEATRGKLVWEALLGRQDTTQLDRWKGEWLACLEELGECYYMASIPPSAVVSSKLVRLADFAHLDEKFLNHNLNREFVQEVRPHHLEMMEKLFGESSSTP